MSESSSRKNDFLRFSAYSFKDLITRRLSEDTKFTDQIYEGSNITILIDLCAYLFQGLLYSLNSAASESMFSDTQIYTNINRLVKMIGYNPKGFTPSSAIFTFNTDSDGSDDDITIPRYSFIDTGKTDSQGKKVYYSIVEDYTTSAGTNEITLYNGLWKMYSTIFTATGDNYETFILDGVKSDAVNNYFIANKYINVYIKRDDKFIQFKGLTDEIFMTTSSKYDGGDDGIDIYKNTDNDRFFSIRLNESKTYEIKFGNDYNGQKLKANDQVYVFYLECNGFDGTLTEGEVSEANLQLPMETLGLKDDLFFESICGISSTDEKTRIKNSVPTLKLLNTKASSNAVKEESVEDIRENAPNYYKLGNRLVTKDDYEYYVKNRFSGNIIDVKCHNNWDYISQFFGWLYKLGKNGILTDYKDYSGYHVSDPKYYIKESKLLKSDYKYADPADSNNVYLWVKMQKDMDIWKKIDEDIIPLKALTSETVCVDPIIMNFALCGAKVQRALEYFNDSSGIFDKLEETYLEITINDNSLYTNSAIKQQINSIFIEYFNENNLRLGQLININDIENEIYAINGIQRIRTVFSTKLDDNEPDKFIEGISMASWSDSLIDKGDDLFIGNGNRKLEDFQFPKLYHLSIVDKIVIIKKSFSNNSSIVQY